MAFPGRCPLRAGAAGAGAPAGERLAAGMVVPWGVLVGLSLVGRLWLPWSFPAPPVGSRVWSATKAAGWRLGSGARLGLALLLLLALLAAAFLGRT